MIEKKKGGKSSFSLFNKEKSLFNNSKGEGDMMREAVMSVDIPGLKKVRSGKVREIFEVSPGFFLIVSTDRISAFDVVLPNGIPDKGRILNQLSAFWIKILHDVVHYPLYIYDDDVCLLHLRAISDGLAEDLKGRMIHVQEAKVIPVECVVRGYISGSLWKEYLSRRGKEPRDSKVLVYYQSLPGDLLESDELLVPIFTPATKSSRGHDINLTYDEMVDHLSRWLFEEPEIKELTTAELLAQNLRSTSLALYTIAREYARKRGIIIADTKFEFGFVDDKLVLIDEVLTPDSSRFWDVSLYKPGGPQPSFDKQYVRDWLNDVAKWNHEPPAPELPQEVIEATSEKYLRAYHLLTGRGRLR